MKQKIKVIGSGQAGNKAVINMIEKGIIDPQSILLLNTTLKDIPTEYHQYAIQFGNGGAAAQRSIGRNMILDSLQNNTVQLENFIQPDDTLCILVSSGSGGSGSGSIPILADYLKSLGVAVMVIAFAGFEDDVQSMKNTVDFFKELNDSYGLQVIDNKRFLKAAANDRNKAEQMANEELATRVKVLLGTEIYESEHNIDDNDMKMLITTPGYCTVESVHIPNIKDVEEFDALMQSMIDDSKSYETEKSAKRIGVVVNASEKIQASIDKSYEILKNAYGVPMQLYQHYQNVQDEAFINILVMGMKAPADEIKGVFAKYKKAMDQVDRAKDSFYSKELDTSDAEDETDQLSNHISTDLNKIKAAKSSFFAKYGMKSAGSANTNEQKTGFNNTAKNEL